MNKFKEGDPVIVVGRICSIRTLVGLYGYITKVFTEKEAGGPGKPCLAGFSIRYAFRRVIPVERFLRSNET